ncbi:MAG: 2-amino-4-hydroxy-6-hydroxymethyldihydropteridine diphosphokinase [Clostridium sp.]|nr:2-amino-4-hydroxy-6-hydroxymethyldihydropteridine diphosphokinase [Prevotella sp.]MCM1428802.1 2-amino-4-hydroxy-6-hydroxymethyldihydropteridine diphosphokinase [Clostridium sp.]MCM1475177.1 2-amino-4-hydroxy-6-hydroxymethyldihydropteridine diphosphokinase [Muribaculaceae bacterium]
MEILVSIGSNTADRVKKLADAEECIRHRESKIEIKETTPFYETSPIGGGNEPYLNAVIRMETELKADAINKIFKEIEKEMGRTEETRNRGEVPIDIDLVIFGNEILRQRDYNTTYFQEGLKKLTFRK